MTLTGTDLLDLADTSRRQESFRFDLLDASNATIGELAVDRSSPPRIRNDITAANPRSLDSLTVLARSAADVDDPRVFAEDLDTVTQRVRAWHVISPGGTGYEWSWGIFLFADDDEPVRSGGTVKNCRLADQSQITTQTLSQSVSHAVGENIGTALTAEAAAAGLVLVTIEATTATLSAPVVGLAGRDSRDKVMSDLCTAGGFLRPYFNNNGYLVCRSAPNLATATVDHTYGPDDRVIAGSIHQSNGLLRAPNVYVARDTAARESELVGRFEVPASAPHSIANIGYERVKSIDVQGLADQTAADAAAAAAYAQDSSVFASTTFASPIDARHDTFGVISFTPADLRADPDGAGLFIEQEWSATLRAGAQMEHDIRRVYV